MGFRLDPQHLKSEVDEFAEIYTQRPIKKNLCGMRFNHSFATWFILRSLSPRFVIESGVWQGHSTWLIEQACPDAKVFCLDPDLSRLTFKSTSATYLQDDFSTFAWEGVDRRSTVCLFDDHQNAYQRLKDLRWAGFTRAIFDDNFPCGEGGCYSLRHVLGGFGHEQIEMSKNFLGSESEQQERRLLERTLSSIGPRQQVLVRANVEDRALLRRSLSAYFEFPPVALNAIDPHWGKPYEGAYETAIPIFPADCLPTNLRELMAESPDEFDYCYIAYVELQP